MSIAAAEARVAAQEDLLGRLERAGHDLAEGKRLLATLRCMLEIERAERRLWSRLAAKPRTKGLPATPAGGGLSQGAPQSR